MSLYRNLSTSLSSGVPYGNRTCVEGVEAVEARLRDGEKLIYMTNSIECRLFI